MGVSNEKQSRTTPKLRKMWQKQNILQRNNIYDCIVHKTYLSRLVVERAEERRIITSIYDSTHLYRQRHVRDHGQILLLYFCSLLVNTIV